MTKQTPKEQAIEYLDLHLINCDLTNIHIHIPRAIDIAIKETEKEIENDYWNRKQVLRECKIAKQQTAKQIFEDIEKARIRKCGLLERKIRWDKYTELKKKWCK